MIHPDPDSWLTSIDSNLPISVQMDQIKLTKPRPSHFETYHFFFVRVSSFLSLFCIFSLFEPFNGSIIGFSAVFDKSLKIHEKSIKIIKYVVFREIGHMPIGRHLHEWPFIYESIVLSHVSWKNDLLGRLQKRSLLWEYFYLYFQGWKFWIFAQQVIFPLQVTKNNKIVGEWSLMQVPASRHITDSTGNVRQYYFYGFFVDFSDFSETAENPFIEPLKD